MTVELDIRPLFESASGLYLVLTPKLRIAAASGAFLQATMTNRAEILGRNLFEVFPDNPADPCGSGVSKLRASLQSVINNRSANTMAIQRYDIRRPEHEGGEFEERYWSAVNSPVFDKNGEVIYIIHKVEDITDFVQLAKKRKKQTDFEPAKKSIPKIAGCKIFGIVDDEPESREANIVAMTVHAREGSREECIVAGMDDYIRKQINPDELSEIQDTRLSLKFQNEQCCMAGQNADTLQQFFQRFTGDAARQLLTLFLSQGNSDLEMLRQALLNQDQHQLASLCHARKGAFASLKFNSLKHLMTKMEERTKANDWTSCNEIWIELETCYREYLERVRNEICSA